MKIITLPNSLRVFVNKRDDLRSAVVGVWVAAGPRYESDEKMGISHFIEHIVFKGSKKRNAFEVAEGIDEIGAYINAYTAKCYTFFYVKALDYQIEKATDILFDMLTDPRLDEGDIETEKGVVIEEIGMSEDDPSDVVYELNEESVFSDCGLRRQILGTRESVKGITADDIRAYMKKFYVPERMIIGISGNFDEEKLLGKVNQYFASVECTDFPLEPQAVPFTKKYALKTMQTEQTHIMLSFPGVGIAHEDMYPLQVCMFILGTGTSSMLYQRIREQLGLVYSIDSFLGKYLGGGYIAVSMSLSPKSEERAIKETIEILKTFSEKLTEKQIAVAKEKLISSLIMSREQPQSKFSSSGHNLMFHGRVIDDDEIIDAIKSVTIDDVRAVSKKYLCLEKMSFCAVGKVKSQQEYESLVGSR